MVGLISLLVATDHMCILQRLHQDEKMVEKINRESLCEGRVIMNPV